MRPERSFAQRNWDKERSRDRYGSQDSSKWQPQSVDLGWHNRDTGSKYLSQRHAERDDRGSNNALRSSPFDRSNFRNNRDARSQPVNGAIKQADGGLNRRERRAAIFGTKTWSNSSSRESHGSHRKRSAPQLDIGKPREQFLRDRISQGSSGRATSQFKSDEHTKNMRPARPPQPHVKVPQSIPYTTAGSEFLYGTHVVKAALQSGRRKLYKLYIYQGVNSQGEEVEQDNSIYKLALAAGVAVSKVRGDWERLLNKMSDQRPHNGYVLEASPVPKLPVTALETVGSLSETFNVQLGHQSAEELAINRIFDIHGSLATLPSVRGTQRYPFLLMLDRIRDPGNLGSIIRSAYFLGAEAIVMIEHGTAPIGPVALKSSASAAEYLPLLMVKNEHAFVRKSQENGWKFFAATSPDSASAAASNGPQPLQLSDVTTPLNDGPCVLLLGSEGEGIRPQLQRIVNGTVGVESGRGSAQGLDSLNVGVAAALLMQVFLQGSKRAASESKGPPEEGVLQPALGKIF